MWAFIYGCASCTFALGLWQMLDADGWCLMMVLYMVLSDILAERRMARRTQVRWKGCFTFIGASLADSGLRQNGLFCGGCACYLSFRFVFGKERGNSRRWRRRGEIQHAYEQTQKKCHRRWQQPATHARKLAFTSTRQQASMSDSRNIKNQVQKYWWILWQEPLDGDRLWATALDGYRHWAMVLIGGSQTKEGEEGCRNLSSTTTASQPKKADIIQCAHVIFVLGVRQGHVGEENALWNARPKMWRHLAACELSFYKSALRAVSLALWQLWDGDGWSWSSTYCTVISKEFCWRAFARSMLMSHSPMGRHKLVCFCLPCALCFLSLCTLKS